ncbi:hypothetical protein ACIPJS_00255 [Streptomyces sp. NPDC086783]
MTPLAHETQARVRAGELDLGAALLPEERTYPVDEAVLAHLRS